MKYVIWASLAVLIISAVILFVGRDFFAFLFFDDTTKQMNAAKKYMDSLTDKDIQAYIERTQKYLKDLGSMEFTNMYAPPDLQQLGIQGIEEQSDEVEYVWLGGMDDTRLDVIRMSNGNFQVTAEYTPYTNRIIWPRQ